MIIDIKLVQLFSKGSIANQLFRSSIIDEIIHQPLSVDLGVEKEFRKIIFVTNEFIVIGLEVFIPAKSIKNWKKCQAANAINSLEEFKEFYASNKQINCKSTTISKTFASIVMQ